MDLDNWINDCIVESSTVIIRLYNLFVDSSWRHDLCQDPHTMDHKSKIRFPYRSVHFESYSECTISLQIRSLCNARFPCRSVLIDLVVCSPNKISWKVHWLILKRSGEVIYCFETILHRTFDVIAELLCRSKFQICFIYSKLSKVKQSVISFVKIAWRMLELYWTSRSKGIKQNEITTTKLHYEGSSNLNVHEIFLEYLIK